MRKPRVIIFDDEPSLLELLELCFAKWGYEVFSYSTPVVCPLNGSSAGICESHAPCADLVISDFQMPQMTGIELFQLQAQRGCKVNRKMKAIMSGHSDGELSRHCEGLGYRFFEKPFACSDLTDWLSECERNIDLSKQLGGKLPNRRHDFKQDIEYCLNGSGTLEKYIGFTVNKSTYGLGLRVFNPLHAGQEITILNGLGAPNLNGTVVWCNKEGENAYSAGLRLSSVSHAVSAS
jgi:CheY-like chemotaxis protein